MAAAGEGELRSRNVNGSVEGTISNGRISALVTTNGYAAAFSVITHGTKQSANIGSKGELRGVSISLARGNEASV